MKSNHGNDGDSDCMIVDWQQIDEICDDQDGEGKERPEFLCGFKVRSNDEKQHKYESLSDNKCHIEGVYDDHWQCDLVSE